MTILADRTTLVTGGASGMGRRLALEAARRGSRVVVWDLDAAALEETRSELAHAGWHEPAAYRCDVSDPAAVETTARRVTDEVGPLDVLVNNAGVASGGWMTDLSNEQIRRAFDVNVLSLFWVTRAFLPSMIERNSGHVVTMASASGLVGVAKLSAYASSKWATVGFDESLRMELRRRAPGVRTTVVCPFYVNTGMFRGVKTRFPWLLPILEEADVVARIVRAIEHERRRLLMPWLVKTVPPLRVVPTSLFDAIADVLGVNTSMDDFVGRAGDERARPSVSPPEAAGA